MPSSFSRFRFQVVLFSPPDSVSYVICSPSLQSRMLDQVFPYFLESSNNTKKFYSITFNILVRRSTRRITRLASGLAAARC